MKFYKITYTATVTRVVRAESEGAARLAFYQNIKFGDFITDTCSYEEITDRKECECEIRMHGLIK